jgi:hypothetical protein
MSSLNSRLARLEHQDLEKKQFFCVIYPDQEAKGYDVSDMRGGSGQHFATLADLETFGARPDVELTLLEVVYASQDEKTK